MSTITLRPVPAFGELVPNCCRITEQGLLWKGEPSTKDLRAIGTQLKRFERGNSWWWGDYLEKIVKAHLAELKAEAAKQGQLFDIGPESITRHSTRYVTEYAASSGLDPQTLWTRRMVAAFYPIESRTAKVSFEHYREAKSAGDLKAALALLKKAEHDSLTVADMRGLIRKQRQEKDGTPPRDDGYGEEMATLEHWSAKKLGELSTCDSATAEQLLDRHFAATAALVMHLMKRAGRLTLEA